MDTDQVLLDFDPLCDRRILLTALKVIGALYFCVWFVVVALSFN